MSTRQVASSTLWQIASQVTMAALSIVTVKMVANGLSKELAGEYNTAYGYLQIFGILADFGLYAVAVREVSKAKDKERMLGTLFLLRFIILLLSLGSALMIAWAIPQWRGTPLSLGITIAVLVPFFTLLAGMLRTVFQVSYRMHYVFIAEVIQRIVTVALTGLILLYGIRFSTDERVYYLFLAFGGVGAFVLLVLSVFYASKVFLPRINWDPQLMRHILILAAPYGIAFLCTALYRQFDVTLIGILRPDHDIQNAYYGFVQRAMDMAYLFPTFLLNSTLPILSERDSRGEDTRDFLGTIFFVVLLIGMTAFLFSSLWARPLMQLLTTDSYLSTATHAGSDSVLQLLSISMLMNCIIVFCFYCLLTRHAWKPLVATLLVGVVISLTSNLALIPGLGFMGATITSVVVHSTLAALLLPQTLRVFPLRLSAVHVRQLALYGVGLCSILFLLKPFLLSSPLTAFCMCIAIIGMGSLAYGTGILRTLKQ
jgi:O-antigen/teichoic acid export membrane protein